MRELLFETEYAHSWADIVRLMALMGENPENAHSLFRFIREDNIAGIRTASGLYTKVQALGALGLVGCGDFYSVLAEATSEEGAMKLCSEWINRSEVTLLLRHPDNIIQSMRAQAALGLIYTELPEADGLARGLYETLDSSYRGKILYESLSRAEQLFYDGLVDAMVIRHLIREMGAQEYQAFQSQEGSIWKIMPHVKKFHFNYDEQ